MAVTDYLIENETNDGPSNLIEVDFDLNARVVFTQGTMQITSDGHFDRTNPITPTILCGMHEQIISKGISIGVFAGDTLECAKNPRDLRGRVIRDPVKALAQVACDSHLDKLIELYIGNGIPLIIEPGNHDYSIEGWQDYLAQYGQDVFFASHIDIFNDKGKLKVEVEHLDNLIPALNNKLRNLGINPNLIPAAVVDFSLSIKQWTVDHSDNLSQKHPFFRLAMGFLASPTNTGLKGRAIEDLLTDFSTKEILLIGGHLHRMITKSIGDYNPNANGNASSHLLLVNKNFVSRRGRGTWSQVLLNPDGTSCLEELTLNICES